MTVHHDQHAISQGERLIHIVGDEKDRAPGTLPQIEKHLVQRRTSHVVETDEGLVHEQNVRLVREHRRDGDPAPHSTGELLGPRAGEFLELDDLEISLDDLLSLAPGNTAGLQPETDVVGHPPPHEQCVALKHDPPVRARPGDGPPVDQHLS